MLVLWSFFGALANGLTGIALMLDGVVYWLLSLLFGVYQELAESNFTLGDVYNEIVQRFMVVIGVFMLFYLAYSLLKALVNPDELNKGSMKIVQNLIISLVLLNVVPMLFTFAFQIQHAIISENIIGQLVLGSKHESIESVGRETAMTVFEAFIKVSPTAELKVDGEKMTWSQLRACIIDNTTDKCEGVGFRYITELGDAINSDSEDADYIPFISTACGVFLCYVMLSFCIDLGLRLVKLCFYQIISPIPIMMRIIPEKKSVFDNWVKATLATFFEVFTRLFIIYLITFLFSLIIKGKFTFADSEIGVFSKILLILGIFAFAKQAPKLISEITGIESGKIKLGLREKIGGTGILAAGALVGGGITAGVRNLTHGVAQGVNNYKNATTGSEKAKSVVRSIAGTAASVVGGTVGGAVRGAQGGSKAKSFNDMRTAASSAATTTTEKREARESYRATHGGTVRGTVTGHIKDTTSGVLKWAGVTTPTEQLKQQQTGAHEVQQARKSVNDRLKAIVETQASTRKSSQEVYVGPNNTGPSFDNLQTLRSQIELMKATGKDSAGNTVTADMLNDYSKAEEKLIKQLKEDVLRGYKTDGTRMSRDEFSAQYDGQLQENLTTLRTKSLQYANVITNYSSDDTMTKQSATRFKEQTIGNQNESLADFVLNDSTYQELQSNGQTANVTRSHASSLVNSANDAINSANTNINNEMNTRIQREQQRNP